MENLCTSRNDKGAESGTASQKGRWLGKKSKLVFDFLTYSRETWFSFSFLKVRNFERMNPQIELIR